MSRPAGDGEKWSLFGTMSPTPPVRDVHAGHYRFLPGIAPFSSGVVAIAGYQVVHATLARADPVA